jgi:hypothetical protein
MATISGACILHEMKFFSVDIFLRRYYVRVMKILWRKNYVVDVANVLKYYARLYGTRLKKFELLYKCSSHSVSITTYTMLSSIFVVIIIWCGVFASHAKASGGLDYIIHGANNDFNNFVTVMNNGALTSEEKTKHLTLFFENSALSVESDYDNFVKDAQSAWNKLQNDVNEEQIAGKSFFGILSALTAPFTGRKQFCLSELKNRIEKDACKDMDMLWFESFWKDVETCVGKNGHISNYFYVLSLTSLCHHAATLKIEEAQEKQLIAVERGASALEVVVTNYDTDLKAYKNTVKEKEQELLRSHETITMQQDRAARLTLDLEKERASVRRLEAVAWEKDARAKEAQEERNNRARAEMAVHEHTLRDLERVTLALEHEREQHANKRWCMSDALHFVTKDRQSHMCSLLPVLPNVFPGAIVMLMYNFCVYNGIPGPVKDVIIGCICILGLAWFCSMCVKKIRRWYRSRSTVVETEAESGRGELVPGNLKKKSTVTKSSSYHPTQPAAYSSDDSYNCPDAKNTKTIRRSSRNK